MRLLKTALFFFIFLTALQQLSIAEITHPPRFSVHTLRYGIETEGKKRRSVESILIKLHDRSDAKTAYSVECFFFKKPVATGKPATIYDTVVFEVISPRASYEVDSTPIPLSSGKENSSKTKSSKKKKGGKASKKTNSSNRAADYPREGYLVRLIQGRNIVSEHASSHALEHLSKETPQVLDQAVKRRSTRHLEAKDLLKN